MTYPGTTRVVKPITDVLRISAYAYSGVMTSPSEHIVIVVASLLPNYSLVLILHLAYDTGLLNVF